MRVYLSPDTAYTDFWQNEPNQAYSAAPMATRTRRLTDRRVLRTNRRSGPGAMGIGQQSYRALHVGLALAPSAT
jgi:hypothetical protein